MNLSCSKSFLKSIGRKLRHGETLSEEEERCFSEFRLGHRKIIKQFRQRACRCFKKDDQLFASRIKKRQTIISKLQDRYSQMDLMRMQDIAGCRIFFSSIKDLRTFRASFVKMNSAIRITNDDQYDYISKPNPHTGYRGIHDVFQEIATGVPGEIRAKIEVQYRTWVQHAWATALEIWDNYYMKGAKFGREDTNIQRFFMLVSDLFCRYLDGDSLHLIEDCSPRRLYASIARLDKEFGIIDKFINILSSRRLRLPTTKIRIVPHEPQPLVLIRPIPLTPNESETRRLIVKTSKWNDLEEKLFKTERDKKGFDTVFVFTEQYARTYNNYLNNPKQFLQYFRTALDLCRKEAVGFWGYPSRFYEALDEIR